MRPPGFRNCQQRSMNRISGGWEVCKVAGLLPAPFRRRPPHMTEIELRTTRFPIIDRKFGAERRIGGDDVE